MKFILKIAVFLALLLISKYTKEAGALTSAKEAKQSVSPILAIYSQQEDVPGNLREADRKNIQAIYKLAKQP